MDKKIITCKKCNRAIWNTDVDDKGHCEDCRTEPAVEAKADKKA